MNMKKAEMEVVRFTESDVIVASSVVLTNWASGDGDHNGTITRNNEVIFQNGNSTQTYINKLANYGYGSNPLFYAYEGDPYPYDLNSIITFDNTGAGDANTNGTYTWSGSVFVKQ